ncbi:hypothetical protein AVEN_116397-1 [Araneus ventricosus]|uniref:Uncharacterized protein n=1 Tax=Araneus ventricosus TaxID=182803 RepID=A0A4Y2KTC1_ARAVE|nr:hypothetical protein AVEN_116397-1 [Araneus ventricosus]
MINFYNSELLMLHEASMDLQFITDMYTCATYVLNYLNKSNSGMCKLLREAASEIRQRNRSIKDQLRMLANTFLNAIEFSAQEAVYYYMLSFPLSNCSRQFTFINSNAPLKLVTTMKSKKELEKLPPMSTDIYVKNIINDYYPMRPTALENLCLADFVTWYEFSKTLKRPGARKEDRNDSFAVNSDDEIGEFQSTYFELIDKSGYVRKRGRAKIIRFVNYDEYHEEYARENVMLFLHRRDEVRMMESAEHTLKENLDSLKENRAKYSIKKTF